MENIKVKDIPKSLSCIYLLKFPNNKIYIGKSIDLKRRMREHNNPNKLSTVVDKAIKKYYGKIEEVTIIEHCFPENLNEREQFWIKHYNSRDKKIGYNISIGGEYDGKRRTWSDEEILDIRKRKYNGERKCNVYKDYTSHPFSSFEKIWLYTSFPEVGAEYKTKSKTRQEYSSIANSGANNAGAKLTVEDVLEIRKRYDTGESVKEIWQDYQIVKVESIRKVCKRLSWKNI